MDDEVEKNAQATIPNIFAQKGESYFRNLEHQQLLTTINTTAKTTVIATGGGAPCFYNAIEIMNKNGVTIWLNQNISVIKKNIQNENTTRPLLANTNDDATLEKKLMTLLESRKNIYAQSMHCLSNSEITLENLEKIIVQYV